MQLPDDTERLKCNTEIDKQRLHDWSAGMVQYNYQDNHRPFSITL